MKIMKITLLGVGAVSALAIAFAASEFDWHLGLMRENPGLFLKAILIDFVICGSSVFIGGVLLSIAMCNSWVKRVFGEGLRFSVFGGVGSCLVMVCVCDMDINIMDQKIYREIEMIKCRKAAEQGDADAQYRLGTCYAIGDGVETNEAEALKWYHKAAEQGHEGAKGRLVDWYKLEEDRAVKWYRKAEVGWYRKAAEQGCVIAQFRLGMCYATGTGVEQNQEKAEEWFDKIKDPFDQFMIGNCFLAPLHFDFIRDEVMAMKWYRKAAEQGYANAQYNLGWMYANGEGVSKDDNEAVKWYRKAAEQGDAHAQNSLGMMYGFGRGVPKDDSESAKWYRKAAEQGLAQAQLMLGLMYRNGRGVTQDDYEAVRLYRKAAEQGEKYAQFNLGMMYDEGRGVTKDESEAAKWYRKSAEQGYARAQNYLGMMYAIGRGVAKDESKAVKWFRKSAEQGEKNAQYNLGLMYEYGQGVAKDPSEAVKWYRKSAEQGHERAKEALKRLGY